VRERDVMRVRERGEISIVAGEEVVVGRVRRGECRGDRVGRSWE